MSKMGQQIKELFERFRVNKKDAAAEMGLSRGTFYAWFNDIAAPRDDTFEVLRAYFMKHYKEDISWLKGGGPPPNQEDASRERLMLEIIKVVEFELARQRLELPPADRVALYQSLYRLMRDSRSVDESAVRDLIGLLAA